MPWSLQSVEFHRAADQHLVLRLMILCGPIYSASAAMLASTGSNEIQQLCWKSSLGGDRALLEAEAPPRCRVSGEVFAPEAAAAATPTQRQFTTQPPGQYQARKNVVISCVNSCGICSGKKWPVGIALPCAWTARSRHVCKTLYMRWNGPLSDHNTSSGH